MPDGRAADDPRIAALADGVRAGDRRALARAITLVESARAPDRAAAAALVDRLLPAAGGALRIGITGVPGVGKSTLIEAFGRHALDQGSRVAVLAVDPSSARTGGSILGDKTRMVELARAEGAFVRPSPTAGTLGGVARRTREAMLLCEAAGFDLVLVETVGVGQSEAAVADMVDLMVLLLLPGGGDELQGIKKGIVERADILFVNKADALADAARHAVADYRHALALIGAGRDGWTVPVLSGSALDGKGGKSVARLWDSVQNFAARARASGAFAARRRDQARAWFAAEIAHGLEAAFRADPAIAADLAAIEAQVAVGTLAPSAAAAELVARFLAQRQR